MLAYGGDSVKKLLSIFTICIIIVTLCGCAVKDTKNKVFTKNEFNITLNEAYVESQQDGFYACYDSATVAVFVVKESFDIMEGFSDYTIEQYANIVMYNCSDKNPSLHQKDGISYIEYSFKNTQINKTYNYLIALYKSDDAFFMVQFTCEDKNYKEYKDYFLDRAKTVRFGE